MLISIGTFTIPAGFNLFCFRKLTLGSGAKVVAAADQYIRVA